RCLRCAGRLAKRYQRAGQVRIAEGHRETVIGQRKKEGVRPFTACPAASKQCGGQKNYYRVALQGVTRLRIFQSSQKNRSQDHKSKQQAEVGNKSSACKTGCCSP